jgi:hypothetical protein
VVEVLEHTEARKIPPRWQRRIPSQLRGRPSRAEWSFDALLKKYGVTNPALEELAKIGRAADTKEKSWAPEGIGLEAIAEGFLTTSKEDHQ